MIPQTDLDRPDVPTFALPFPADSDLQRRVKAFLADQSRYPLRLLDVEARGGTVTLRGFLATYHEKQLAVHRVLRVAGVHRLIDEIVVRSAVPQTPNQAFAFEPTSSRLSMERSPLRGQTA
jgi:hypothetical protein